jgi:hypothetical protein
MLPAAEVQCDGVILGHTVPLSLKYYHSLWLQVTKSDARTPEFWLLSQRTEWHRSTLHNDIVWWLAPSILWHLLCKAYISHTTPLWPQQVWSPQARLFFQLELPWQIHCHRLISKKTVIDTFMDRPSRRCSTLRNGSLQLSMAAQILNDVDLSNLTKSMNDCHTDR